MLLGQARERKDPAGGSSGAPSCLEKQHDGWLPLAAVNSHERQVLFPGSCTLSFDLPHWPVCWCTGRGCPSPLQVKARHYCSCKGPAACCYPPTSISTQSGQMVTGLEVESWTLEDKASNLQIRSRISTNQLHRKLKSWGKGVGTCFSLKGTASKQLHPGGYLRHIINLCSRDIFQFKAERGKF